MEDSSRKGRAATPSWARDLALHLLGPMATNDEVCRWADAILQPEGAAAKFVARRYPVSHR